MQVFQVFKLWSVSIKALDFLTNNRLSCRQRNRPASVLVDFANNSFSCRRQICLLDTNNLNNLNNQEKHNYAKHKIPLSTSGMFVLSILEHANIFILLIELLSQLQVSKLLLMTTKHYQTSLNVKSTKEKATPLVTYMDTNLNCICWSTCLKLSHDCLMLADAMRAAAE